VRLAFDGADEPFYFGDALRLVVLPMMLGLVAGCGRVGFDLLPEKQPVEGGAGYDAGGDGEAPTGRDGGGPPDGGDSDSGTQVVVIPPRFVLGTNDDFEAGTDGRPCRIVGNGNSITTRAPYSGHIWIKNCRIEGLGSISKPAFDVELTGSGYFKVQGSSFYSSGAVVVDNADTSTTTFEYDTIDESSVVALDPDVDNSTPAFSAKGSGTSPKTFRGNRIYRSSASFASANWLVGGDGDEDSNILIGARAALVLGAPGLVVRGNYVHNLRAQGSQDEFALAVKPGTNDVLAEHNVFQRGSAVVRGFGGEFRYNAVLDASVDGWMKDPYDGAKIHHDVFAMCAVPSVDIVAGIDVGSVPASGVDIYANTFDGGGTTMRVTGPLLSVRSGSSVASFRSNLITAFPFSQSNGTAALRGSASEPLAPPPARLGYADYNLFHSPDAAPGAVNYGLAVAGLTVRTDAGFGRNDAPAGGGVDEQVDPELTGSTRTCFPFDDATIRSGETTVSEILAFYRGVYTPKADSPAIGKGDPKDGTGHAIGAIGEGTDDADRFGRGP
jgi:hypothetical protein